MWRAPVTVRQGLLSPQKLNTKLGAFPSLSLRSRTPWIQLGGLWERCELPQRVRASPLQPTRESDGARCELPSGVRGRTSAENGFWRILKVTERSFLYLTKSEMAICPLLQILGGLVPPLAPVIYAHECSTTRKFEGVGKTTHKRHYCNYITGYSKWTAQTAQQVYFCE